MIYFVVGRVGIDLRGYDVVLMRGEYVASEGMYVKVVVCEVLMCV